MSANADRTEHVLAAIDGALEDWTVSGDAMRWTPEPARPTRLLGPLLADPRWPGGALDQPFHAYAVQGGSPAALALRAQLDDPQVRDRYAEAFAELGRQVQVVIRPVVEAYLRAAEEIGRSLAAMHRHLVEAGVLPQQPPADVRARALWLAQHRSSGPGRLSAGQVKRPRRHL